MNDTYLNSLLGENEQVIFVARQHWLVLAGKILSESVLAIATVVLITLIWVLWVPNPLIALGYLLLLLPLLSLLRDVLIWANRKFIVTTWRVIEISGVFSKDVTDSSLDKINDVKMEQSFLGRLLGYGDIEILTASESGINKFTRIDDPIRFKTTMLNAKEALEQAPLGAQKRVKTDIPTLISQLDELRQHGVLTEEEFQKKKAELLAKL